MVGDVLNIPMNNPEFRGNPELARVQQDFDRQLSQLKEQLATTGEIAFRYDAPEGFALSASVGDIEFGSVAYRDEDSRIIHSEQLPIIASNIFIVYGRDEYDEITFIGSHNKYTNDAMRLAKVYGDRQCLKKAIEQLDGLVVVDRFYTVDTSV